MSDGPTLAVLYTCHECGLREKPVAVRERTKAESVVEWMDAVAAAIGADHLRISPLCRSGHCELKVPLYANAKMIGEAQRQ